MTLYEQQQHTKLERDDNLQRQKRKNNKTMQDGCS